MTDLIQITKIQINGADVNSVNAIPKNFAEALRLCANLAEQNEELSKNIKSNSLENYFKYFDLIENRKLKIIIDEMFYQGDINELTYSEVMEYISDIKTLNISINDEKIIENLFKEFGSQHYYNLTYGFEIFLNISHLAKEEEKTKSMKYKTYLIKNPITGHYKIGKTSRTIEKRVKELAVGAKLEIISFCNFDIEKKLHKRFESKLVYGEWFELTKYDIEIIKAEFEIEDVA